MKRILTIILFCAGFVLNGQTITGDKVIARTQLELATYKVTGISNDSGMTANSIMTLPTQYAVRNYVQNYVNSHAASAAGSSGQVQYNNAGSFGALDSLTVASNPDRLGVGVPTPTARVDIQGSGATSATNALRVRNSSGTELISFKNDGKIGIGISSATNPTIDAVVGFADVATNANESGGLRLRSNATDGNTRILKLGISHTGIGGVNQGYGYIQFGYWGGSMNNPIVLQPLGGQVSIGQLAGLSDFSLISKGEVGIRANDDVAGNTIGGRVSFLSQSGNGKSAFIAQIKEGASYYSSNGLIFATASGADISSSTGTERLRISGNGNISIGNVTPLAGLHNAINTTASTPSMLLSGTGYSGGTATTTKPTLLIEPTGTTSTGWSTSGTKLGVNAESGFSGNLLDLQVNGSSFMSVLGGGTIIRSNASAYRNNTVNGSFYFDAGTIVIRDGNSGDTNVKLSFGSLSGTAHPMLKRNAAGIDIRLADDSGYGAIQSLYDRFGSGSPESVVTAPVGAVYHRTDGGAGTSFYVKESGTGNTGWIAK